MTQTWNPTILQRDCEALTSGTPPARKTPYRPRSGIVPPLVTARRCAPRRPTRVPATRSQVIRGRSSAKSSDG